LKPGMSMSKKVTPLVAPRTGAWIETLQALLQAAPGARRPPHGGVD